MVFMLYSFQKLQNLSGSFYSLQVLIQGMGYTSCTNFYTQFLCSSPVPVLSLADAENHPKQRSGQTEARSDSLKILTIGTADSGGTMYPVGKAISLVIGDADSSIKINISASTGLLRKCPLSPGRQYRSRTCELRHCLLRGKRDR